MNRQCPKDCAKCYRMGTKKRGANRKTWEVKKRSNGVKYWKQCGGSIKRKTSRKKKTIRKQRGGINETNNLKRSLKNKYGIKTEWRNLNKKLNMKLSQARDIKHYENILIEHKLQSLVNSELIKNNNKSRLLRNLTNVDNNKVNKVNKIKEIELKRLKWIFELKRLKWIFNTTQYSSLIYLINQLFKNGFLTVFDIKKMSHIGSQIRTNDRLKDNGIINFLMNQFLKQYSIITSSESETKFTVNMLSLLINKGKYNLPENLAPLLELIQEQQKSLNYQTFVIEFEELLNKNNMQFIKLKSASKQELLLGEKPDYITHLSQEKIYQFCHELLKNGFISKLEFNNLLINIKYNEVVVRDTCIDKLMGSYIIEDNIILNILSINLMFNSMFINKQPTDFRSRLLLKQSTSNKSVPEELYKYIKGILSVMYPIVIDFIKSIRTVMLAKKKGAKSNITSFMKNLNEEIIKFINKQFNPNASTMNNITNFKTIRNIMSNKFISGTIPFSEYEQGIRQQFIRLVQAS